MPEGDTGQAGTFTQAQVDEMVAGLKAKNQELLGSMAKVKDQLKPWEGLDPEKVRTVLAEHEKTTAERQKVQGDWDAREKTLRDGFAAEHSKVVEPLKSELATARNDLFEAIAIRDAVEAMADPEIKANPKLILPVIRSELAVEVVDGHRVTVVKGEDGKPRYHPTSNKLVTVKDRLKELRAAKEFGGGFEGTTGSGSGAQRSDGNPQNGVHRISRADAADPRKYQAAKAQAEKAGARLEVEAAA